MTGPTVRPGMRFTHARQLRTDWEPAPGQRYADAPKQVMRVTRVATSTVWYRPDDDAGGRFRADLAEMEEGGSIVGGWLDTAAEPT